MVQNIFSLRSPSAALMIMFSVLLFFVIFQVVIVDVFSVAETAFVRRLSSTIKPKTAASMLASEASNIPIFPATSKQPKDQSKHAGNKAKLNQPFSNNSNSSQFCDNSGFNSSSAVEIVVKYRPMKGSLSIA